MSGFGKRVRAGADSGAQAVEFALVWTFAVAPLLYGLIAFGFVMNQQVTASQLAREAARAYAICAGNSASTAATCTTAATARFNSAKPSGFSGTLDVSGSACFPTTTATDAVATVTLTSGQFVLPLPFPSKIVGKATTPCGG